MTLAFVLVLVSLTALLLMYAARGKTSAIGDLDDLAGRTRPVDIEAFRNLIDPAEEDFLRENLPASEFLAIQKERLYAAMEYVSCAAHNAAVLVRLGEAARLSLDPKIAEAGRQLPGAHLSAGRLVDNYQHLSSLAGQLAFMQHPARASRLPAIL